MSDAPGPPQPPPNHEPNPAGHRDVTVSHDPARRPIRRRRTGLRAIGALVVLALLAAGAGAGVLYWRYRDIPRRDAGCLDRGDRPCDPVTEDGTPLVDIAGMERLGGPNTRNILMLGLDSRENLPADQEPSFGEVAGSRTDTIMLLRIDRDTDRAWVLSFPRDLWVRIAGTGEKNRINAAYVKGLPTLVATIRENFDIPIWHVVLVDFVGFQRLVSTVDGVTICFPLPTRDTVTGLDQPKGCNLLDAQQATAYVRSRHLQVGRNGSWEEDPSGDFGRITRQQTFIRAALSRALRQSRRNPVKLNAMLGSLHGAITIDSGFSFKDVTSLAADLRSFDPEQLETFTVPANGRRIDGKAVLVVDPEKAAEVVGGFGY